MNQHSYDTSSALGPLPSLIDPCAVAGPSSYAQHSSTSTPQSKSVASCSSPQRKQSGGTNGNGNAKKKRSLVTDDSEDSGASRAKTRELNKKKKAARACFHCQKAHLTCDDSRPCQRCIKRGLADNCMEGQRKKAKYLLDDNELEAIKNTKKSANGVSTQPESLTGPDPMFNLSFDPNFQFGSEAANLEYSILSAILGNPNHDQPHLSSAVQPPPVPPAYGQRFATPAWPADPTLQGMLQHPPQTDRELPPPVFDPIIVASGRSQSQSAPAAQFEAPPLFDERQLGPPSQSSVLPQIQSAPALQAEFAPNIYSSSGATTYQAGQQPSCLQQPQYNLFPQPQTQLQQTQQSPEPRAASAPLLNHTSSVAHSHRSISSMATPPTSVESPMSVNSVVGAEHVSISTPPVSTWSTRHQHQQGIERMERMEKCGDVYDSVTKAFDYTNSYHFLMKFLPTRFEKNDILRVVRALAIFRPSLIALQTPLLEEDEIFVEKCFQRSLLEFDKLISFSGTPTVVWRRTGEICLVGAEFCLLTEWTKEELIGTGQCITGKYIYELFENQSVVEYWENFAVHAFENTTQSVYSHCVLLKPSGEPVPCAFCFSIRRDLFDLPSVVIGQWLPLI